MISHLNQSKVDALILEYETQGPHELIPLMDMQRKLSAQSYWYAKLLGDIAKEYRAFRVRRKSYLTINVQKSSQTSNAAREAEVKASKTYRDLEEQEETLEGRKEAGRLQLGAINKVLDSMRQEISDLKKEKEATLKGQV
jgi:hypothetical protein